MTCTQNDARVRVESGSLFLPTGFKAEHLFFVPQGGSAAAKDNECSTWHIKGR